MKASQSSLYREIENLMLWFIPVGNNIPKDFALRELGGRMLNEITDALTACNSYMGFLKYNQSYALRRRIFGSLPHIWKYVYVTGKYNKVVLKKKYRPVSKMNGKTLNKKGYGNQIFKRNASKNRRRRSKKNSELQHP